MLDHQDVVRFPAGDQVPGVFALGMQRVRGDHAACQVQRRQRRELGNLIGLAVHGRLRENRSGLLIEGSQQMRGLAIADGMPGAAQGLAIHRHRAALAAVQPARDCSRTGLPGRHGGVQLAGINRLQDPSDGRLVRRPERAFQGVEADA